MDARPTHDCTRWITGDIGDIASAGSGSGIKHRDKGEKDDEKDPYW